MNFAHMAEGLIGILAIIGAGTLIFGIAKLLVWITD
jgi:hypothetical protein